MSRSSGSGSAPRLSISTSRTRCRLSSGRSWLRQRCRAISFPDVQRGVGDDVHPAGVRGYHVEGVFDDAEPGTVVERGGVEEVGADCVTHRAACLVRVVLVDDDGREQVEARRLGPFQV